MTCERLGGEPLALAVRFESEAEMAAFVKAWESEEPMKAGEVMKVLGISRVTLCHYVKKGLIKTVSNYTGKQYRYSKDSVLRLKKKQR